MTMVGIIERAETIKIIGDGTGIRKDWLLRSIPLNSSGLDLINA